MSILSPSPTPCECRALAPVRHIVPAGRARPSLLPTTSAGKAYTSRGRALACLGHIGLVGRARCLIIPVSEAHVDLTLLEIWQEWNDSLFSPPLGEHSLFLMQVFQDYCPDHDLGPATIGGMSAPLVGGGAGRLSCPSLLPTTGAGSGSCKSRPGISFRRAYWTRKPGPSLDFCTESAYNASGQDEGPGDGEPPSPRGREPRKTGLRREVSLHCPAMSAAGGTVGPSGLHPVRVAGEARPRQASSTLPSRLAHDTRPPGANRRGVLYWARREGPRARGAGRCAAQTSNLHPAGGSTDRGIRQRPGSERRRKRRSGPVF